MQVVAGARGYVKQVSLPNAPLEQHVNGDDPALTLNDGALDVQLDALHSDLVSKSFDVSAAATAAALAFAGAHGARLDRWRKRAIDRLGTSEAVNSQGDALFAGGRRGRRFPRACDDQLQPPLATGCSAHVRDAQADEPLPHLA